MRTLSRILSLFIFAFFVGCDSHSLTSPSSQESTLAGTWIARDTIDGSFWESRYAFEDSTLLIRTLYRIESNALEAKVSSDTLRLRFDPVWQVFQSQASGSNLAMTSQISGKNIRLILGRFDRITYHRIPGNALAGSPWIGNWESDLVCGSHYCEYDTLVFTQSGVYRLLNGPKMQEPDRRFVEKDGLIRVMDGDSTIETMAPVFAGDSVRFLYPGFSCGMDGKCQPHEPILMNRVMPE